MAGFLQNVLRKLGDSPAESPRNADAKLGSAPGTKPAGASSASSASKVPPLPASGGHSNGRGVELPLQPILAGLPLELQPRLKHPDAGALTVCVPLEKILAQLSSGTVKVSFGDLRQAAPGLFTPEADKDRVMIPLPLAEVLSRLNPALIMRRREQKLVEVPADIRSPFDRNGQGLVFSTGPTQPEAAPAAQPLRPAAPLATPAVAHPARSPSLRHRRHPQRSR